MNACKLGNMMTGDPVLQTQVQCAHTELKFKQMPSPLLTS